MNKHASTAALPAVVQPQAPARRPRGKAPIVPPASVNGRSLGIVIGIMVFLASLTAGAVYIVNQSAAAWLRDVASEVTVQIKPQGTPADVEKTANEITNYLGNQFGVRRASLLSVDQSAELVEPWLGQVSAIKELPLPRLVAVQVDRDNPPDVGELSTALTNKFPTAALDDHRAWQSQIRRVTGSLAFAGLLIIVLVATATVAIVVSAARSAIASNRDIVEVLNFVGAEERFIARQFELHFLKLGIKAGIVGAAAAGLVFFLMPIIGEYMSGAVNAEYRRLVGAGQLDLMGYFCLTLVVVVIAAICQLTSRYGVRRILDGQNQ
jgi:cell division transport system permease protein